VTDRPDFFVRGDDGRDYPASRSAAWEWIRSGRVRREHQVFDTMTQQWTMAGAHSDLRTAFLSPAQAAQRPQPAQPSGPRYANRLLGLLILSVVMVLLALSSAWGLGVAALTGLLAVFAWRGSRPLLFAFGPESSSKTQAVALTIFSLVILATAGMNALSERSRSETEQAEKRRAADAAEATRQAGEKHRAELRHNAPVFAAQLADATREIDTSYRQGAFAKAHAQVAKAGLDAKDYLELTPLPPELAEPGDAFRKVSEKVDHTFDARQKLNRANDLIGQKQWVAAEDELKAASGVAKQLSGDHQADLSAEIARKQRIVGSHAAAARKKDQEAKIFTALCGPSPTLSAWDGGVYEIEAAVKQVAHDPDSIDVENCTRLYLDRKRCWVTRCQVRGKNAFGAKILSVKTFSVSKLGVSEVD
jgi:hypothetical protein